MFQRFTPDYRVDRVYEIDLEKLHKMGFEALLFDIDNTQIGRAHV